MRFKQNTCVSQVLIHEEVYNKPLYVISYLCIFLFLLRKIALPYPHKCLFGFVEQKRIDRQEFFKEYSCHKR